MAIPGVICGHVGLSNIRQSEGRLTGEGLCVAGLIIGYLAIGTWLVFFFCFGGLAFLGALME
jgi:hypothetical protein